MKRMPLFLFAAAAWAVAARPAASQAPTRIHYFGNSLTDQVRYDYFKKLCDESGHPVEWKREMAPGVPVSFWWSQRPKWEKKLTEERWDVVTLQPFQNFEVEYEAGENFAKFLNEKQPDVQLYIYAQWQGRRTGDWLSDFLQTSKVVTTNGWDGACRARTAPTSWLENVAADARKAGCAGTVERSLKNQYELTVEGLRARVPMKNPVKLIPVGHVLELLDSKMRAGLVPGYRTPYQFYNDGIHIDNVGSYIVACTFHSTIFKTSPVGWPVGEYQSGPHYHGKSARIGDDLARAIQETVWEVVASHPLTGVTSGEPVKVASASLAPAVRGEPYRFQLNAAFGRGPCTWSAAGALPEGLSVDGAGQMTGTVAAAPGDYRVEMSVADAAGAKAARALPLEIAADTSPEIVTPSELPPRRLGEYFSLKLENRGGNGAMQWDTAKRDGFLPPGLVLHPDGTLAGSPGQEGLHAFELKVTDADRGAPESATATFSIRVGPAGAGVFRVRPVAADVKADGVLDEPFWDLKEPIAKRVVGEKTDIQAFFDIVRKGGDLYVAVKVIDPARHVDGNDLPNGDSIELFVDVLNNREEVYNYDDRRIVVAPIKGHYQGLLVAPTSFGHRGQCVETADGYTAEFWLSFWALNFQNKNFPAVMGLDVAVNDDDDGDGRDSQVVWQGTKDDATVPQFGTIVIEPEPAPTAGK
jgi:hypothetical protein